ncbi:MAG: hypothetical protein U0931_31845 [Vulcanimicrobiota bacterium]
MNLLENPNAEVDFRGRRLPVYAIPVKQTQAEVELKLYEQRHPWLLALLKFCLGPGVFESIRLVRLEIIVGSGVSDRSRVKRL